MGIKKTGAGGTIGEKRTSVAYRPDDTITTVYKRFTEEKITIPFTQRDVHLRRE